MSYIARLDIRTIASESILYTGSTWSRDTFMTKLYRIWFYIDIYDYKRNIRLFQNLVRIINDSSHVPLYQFLTHFTCSVHAYGVFKLPRSLYIFIECTLNKLVTFYIPNYPKIHLFLMVSWISSKITLNSGNQYWF